MKVIDDLKQSVQEYVERLENNGLYLEQIFIEYTREAHSPGDTAQRPPDKRKVVVKLSSSRDTVKTIWY